MLLGWPIRTDGPPSLTSLRKRERTRSQHLPDLPRDRDEGRIGGGDRAAEAVEMVDQRTMIRVAYVHAGASQFGRIGEALVAQRIKAGGVDQRRWQAGGSARSGEMRGSSSGRRGA